MTISQRRFWLWVNVVSLGIALVGIFLGLALDSHPVLQAVLLIVGVAALILGPGSAVVVAIKVRRDQRP